MNGQGLIIALYMDDIIVFGEEGREIDAVKDKLRRSHPMTDLGLVKKSIGIRFNWRSRFI